MSNKAIDVNSNSAILSAVLLGTLGVLSFIVQPGLVQAFVTELAVGEPRAVDLAGIEMLGLALATIILAVGGTRLDWRHITLAGLVFSIIGNCGSAFFAGQDSSMFASMRFVAGFGQGIIISISFTFVGLTKKVDRNLGIYLVSLLTYGAFMIWQLPNIIAGIGLQGVFYTFAVLTGLGLLTINHLPRGAEDRQEFSPLARQLPMILLLVAMLAILAYNMAIGIAWAILFLVGLKAGLSEQVVANALFWSQVTAIFGAIGSIVLSEKISRFVPLFGGIILSIICIALLLDSPSYMEFLIAICGFNFLWNFSLPFLLATVGDFDLKGRMMPIAIALQMIGLGIAPIIAARLIGDGSYWSAEMATIIFFIVSLVLLAVPMLRHRYLLKTHR
jgi:hypothetical protein|tara:strand:- start:17818 stop:18984 length:1167 start_codon:yes stop_codon:yes gene_type:complete